MMEGIDMKVLQQIIEQMNAMEGENIMSRKGKGKPKAMSITIEKGEIPVKPGMESDSEMAGDMPMGKGGGAMPAIASKAIDALSDKEEGGMEMEDDDDDDEELLEMARMAGIENPENMDPRLLEKMLNSMK